MPLLSDFEGHATGIAVTTPGGVDLPDPVSLLHKQLGNLPTHLHPQCQIVWICAAANTPVAPFEIDGTKVTPVRIQPDRERGQGRMRWIQDPFVCCVDGTDHTWVIPANADSLAKEVIAKMARQMERQLMMSPLHLEGGNMLQLGDVLFLGKDLAHLNGIPLQGTWLHPARAPWEALEATIKKLFGVKKIVWIGTLLQIQLVSKGVAVLRSTWQPFFHLDLFLLPGGLSPQGKMRIFLGEICLVEHIHLSDQHRKDVATLNAALAEIEAQLRKAIPDLEIARLPIITTIQGSRIHIQSLCNGWVETGPQGKHAYLPDYQKTEAGIVSWQFSKKAHLQAEHTLESWGFTVHWIDMDFPTLAREGGALHCAVKILERTT